MLNGSVESRTRDSCGRTDNFLSKIGCPHLSSSGVQGHFKALTVVHGSVWENWVSGVQNALEGILKASRDVLLFAVYCCCCLANVSLPGLGGTVPESKPFFYVNVADIEMLETEVSYVACKYDGRGVTVSTSGRTMSGDTRLRNKPDEK